MLIRVPMRAQAGVTLVEVMLAVAIFSILMVMAIPSFTGFLRNMKIKSAAEGILAGLQLARAEAVRRNTIVRFQLVSDLTSGCTLTLATPTVGASPKPNWIVSLDDPTGACDAAPSDTVAPRIIQKWNADENAAGMPWAILPLTAGISYLGFNGLGRLNPAIPGAGPSPSVARIPIETSGLAAGSVSMANPNWDCTHWVSYGTVRCLRVTVTNSGQAKICDPKVTDATDPRYCT